MFKFLFKLEKENSHLTIYGFNHLYRDYSNYPPFLPLLCNYEHGMCQKTQSICSGDIPRTKYLLLAVNKYRADIWKNHTKVPIVIAGSPFVNYRRKHNIVQDKDAKGTIVFPAHACAEADAVYSINDFCEELNKMSDEFKPFTINLHIEDVKLGKDKIYTDRGFEVTCAGDVYSPDFAKNFYNNLKKFKYATGNEPGSSVFYCIEMGIPYFLMNNKAIMKINIPTQDSEGWDGQPVNDLDFIKSFCDLIPQEPVTYIPEEFKEHVEEMLGLNEMLSPVELNNVLIKTCIKNLPSYVKERLAQEAQNEFHKRVWKINKIINKVKKVIRRK